MGFVFLVLYLSTFEQPVMLRTVLIFLLPTRFVTHRFDVRVELIFSSGHSRSTHYLTFESVDSSSSEQSEELQINLFKVLLKSITHDPSSMRSSHMQEVELRL